MTTVSERNEIFSETVYPGDTPKDAYHTRDMVKNVIIPVKNCKQHKHFKIRDNRMVNVTAVYMYKECYILSWNIPSSGSVL